MCRLYLEFFSPGIYSWPHPLMLWLCRMFHQFILVKNTEQVTHIKCEVFATVASIIRKKNILMWVFFLFFAVYQLLLLAGQLLSGRPAVLMLFPGSDAQCAKGIPSLPWWGTAEMPVNIPLSVPLHWH